MHYLTTVAATLRPNTVGLRADSLIVFSEYLAAAHPGVRSLTQLNREHIEGFLGWNHKRPWRGRLARDQAVSAAVSKRTVIDLRCFLDDLALWGWAERPPRRLLFPADIPRLDKPLPRALPPDGVQICRVDVSRSPRPVFLIAKGGSAEFFTRKGNASHPLTNLRQACEYVHDHWR